MNYEAVCRTAPATPGLLLLAKLLIHSSILAKHFNLWKLNKKPGATMNLFNLCFHLKHRPSVEMSMCVSVSSLLRYRLNVFLPPLPKVGCPKLLEIQNPWGKVMERSGLRFEHFCLEVL